MVKNYLVSVLGKGYDYLCVVRGQIKIKHCHPDLPSLPLVNILTC